jgi:hypothetical protein
MNLIPMPLTTNTPIPDEVEDLRYCVLDYSNASDVDFYFIPLIFLDSFPRPSADLQIGKYRIQMPLDWSIVIADKDFGHMEIIELKDLRDRPFEAFIMNPITSYMPDFGEITHVNNFPDVTWTMPKLKFGHILVVPLEQKVNPACAFFVRDIHRLPDSLDLTKVFS